MPETHKLFSLRDRALVIASEAKQSSSLRKPPWIASSLRSSQ